MTNLFPGQKLGSPQSIVVLRALMLGDLLCAVPAFRALRKAYPLARITLAGLPWAAGFVRRFRHLLDDFLEFPGYPGLPETAVDTAQVPRFFEQAQARRFDAAIQMHGSGLHVNSVTVLLGARRTAGFFVPGEYCPDPQLFLPFPDIGHEIDRCLQLTGFLGMPGQGRQLEFPLEDGDYEDFYRIPGVERIGEAYACIHAGSRLPSRRWLAERFLQVAESLSSLGLTVVLTGASQEIELAAEITRNLKVPHLNLVGKTSLGALGVLLSRAGILVCNDTGVSHIASALRVPSVVIVTGSDYSRWAPLDFRRHQPVYRPIDCRPCTHAACPIGHPCAHAVEVQEVVAAAKQLLGRHGLKAGREALCDG